jgi:hypothetical protein
MLLLDFSIDCMFILSATFCNDFYSFVNLQPFAIQHLMKLDAKYLAIFKHFAARL